MDGVLQVNPPPVATFASQLCIAVESMVTPEIVAPSTPTMVKSMPVFPAPVVIVEGETVKVGFTNSTQGPEDVSEAVTTATFRVPALANEGTLHPVNSPPVPVVDDEQVTVFATLPASVAVMLVTATPLPRLVAIGIVAAPIPKSPTT